MELSLTNGLVTKVSAEDHEYLAGFNWGQSGFGYVVRSTSLPDRTVVHHYLHIVILERMGFLNFEDGDHRDRDQLNNQRDNLRPCTRTQNLMNRGLLTSNTTGYKGVSFTSREGKYRAYINYEQKQKHLGYFDCPIEAAKAYNRAAKRFYGEFARLNDL